MFGGRRFSINRHTGEPKPLVRRFSIGEPSAQGKFISKISDKFAPMEGGQCRACRKLPHGPCIRNEPQLCEVSMEAKERKYRGLIATEATHLPRPRT